MNIALIGYGKMGKIIEQIAIERGHTIGLIIDIDNPHDLNKDMLQDIDVAIEFTIPASAYGNILKCFEADIPVVVGTTGWLEKLPLLEQKCNKENKGLFYASNYSLGVNIFFELNKHLAKLMNPHSDYDVAMEEIHHTQKLDAPSGTAITLAEGVIDNMDRKKGWICNDFKTTDDLQIVAKRLGTVPGTHTLTYDGPVDKIEISHEAKGRQGFAFGAVLAAEYMNGKTGKHGMKELLNL